MRKEYLVIDVGGTAVKYGILNEDGTVIEKGETPTTVKDTDSYLDLLGSLFQKYQDRVQGVCMSAPGRIDSDTGYFYTGGSLHFMKDINLKELFEGRYNIPFEAENDGKCAALAELWKGSMKGISNGAVMTLGTGIGGALILNGSLYKGTTFAAGELSTVPLYWDRKYDRHACWYVRQGVGYTSRRYAEVTGEDPDTVNGRVLFAKAAEGEQAALDTLKDYCESLASGIYGLQAVLDLERYAIGGGISRQPLLFEMLNRSMEETFDEAHGFPASRPEIVPCTFVSDANMIGALYHYLQKHQ